MNFGLCARPKTWIRSYWEMFIDDSVHNSKNIHLFVISYPVLKILFFGGITGV